VNSTSMAVLSVMFAMGLSACGDSMTVSTEQPTSTEDGIGSAVVTAIPVPDVSDVSSESLTEFTPHAQGELWLVGPPDDGPDWPFRIPSGGVMLAASSGYEYDRGQPDELVRRSIAVAVVTVTSVAEPSPLVPRDGERPSDKTGQLEFVHDVVIPVVLRVEDVVVGAGAIEPGKEYGLEVSAWEVDGKLFEFEESLVPRPGERYLVFVTFNRIEDAPVTSGTIRTTAAGDGRILLATAEAEGLLDPARWSESLRSEGLLP
jgi:hypothetical protein